jgi:exopolysaccharide biosynthesis WecB/TagA/CpsF family protein
MEEVAPHVPRVELFGVHICRMDRAAAVLFLDSVAGKLGPQWVAFANANLINLARTDGHLRSQLCNAIVLNDGLGLDIASFLIYGQKFCDNLNGTDFIPYYLRNTARSFRIFVLGGRSGVATRCAHKIADLYPRHVVVGNHHGYFSESEESDVLNAIRSSKAELLLVGLGNPKQEYWLSEHIRLTGCELAFGVGALLDFISGDFPRAPKGIRLLRLEWLFRLALEPRRLGKRYLVDAPSFIAAALRERLSQRAKARRA